MTEALVAAALLVLLAVHLLLRSRTGARLLPKSLGLIGMLGLGHGALAAWTARAELDVIDFRHLLVWSAVDLLVTTGAVGLNAYVRSVDVPGLRGFDYLTSLRWWHHVPGAARALEPELGGDWAERALTQRAPLRHAGPAAALIAGSLVFAGSVSAEQGRHDSPPPIERVEPSGHREARSQGATAPDPAANEPVARLPMHTSGGDCGPSVDIGWTAPSALGRAMRSLIVGDHSLRRVGVGAPVAGCISGTGAVHEHPAVHYATGEYGDGLQSLIVASGERPAALLLQGAAVAAQREAFGGRLLGASARLAAGTGTLG